MIDPRTMKLPLSGDTLQRFLPTEITAKLPSRSRYCALPLGKAAMELRKKGFEGEMSHCRSHQSVENGSPRLRNDRQLSDSMAGVAKACSHILRTTARLVSVCASRGQ